MEVSILNSIPTTGKEEIALFSSKLNEDLDLGTQNPLQVLKAFKAVEKAFEMIKPKLTEFAITEAKKYPGKEFEAFGVEFSVKEAGVKWDYSGCGDLKHTALMKKKAALDKEIKEREEFLRAIKNPLENNVDEDTGEIYTIHPPVKKSTTIVQTTFK